ncbi:MAG: hypothetical protein MUF54_20340 [Polyangiaceae bacterium]|jgi:hypothetical protein|nr:hypothetical protein [Polyangiaceae bacterium]
MTTADRLAVYERACAAFEAEVRATGGDWKAGVRAALVEAEEGFLPRPKCEPWELSPKASNILHDVCRACGVKPKEIVGRRPRRCHAPVKHLAMLRMREAGISLPVIARVFGLRHHQPVLYGIRRAVGRAPGESRRAA